MLSSSVFASASMVMCENFLEGRRLADSGYIRDNKTCRLEYTNFEGVQYVLIHSKNYEKCLESLSSTRVICIIVKHAVISCYQIRDGPFWL